jgi:hypothetical protein
MLATEALSDLELLVRSRHGLIHIDSVEEERVLLLLRHLAERLTLPLFSWTRTRGIARDGNANAIYDTQEPGPALAHIVSAQIPALYHFPAFAGLESDVLVQRLREVALELGRRNGALVITGTEIAWPASLRPLVATTPLPAPSPAELRSLVQLIARDLGRARHVEVRLDGPDEARLFSALNGLTLLEAERVLTRAMVEDGLLDASDIAQVVETRARALAQEGVLEYYPVEESLTEVAGMAGLKDWLRKRTAIIRDPDGAAAYGLTFPRGMLLIGVPGCGKSLCARTVAGEWQLPLLRMDTGSLYNRYVGETEGNFRRAMRTAEAMAPCVLFIDELEKAFGAGGSEDGGVSSRVLGSFLSWLQDRTAHVFVPSPPPTTCPACRPSSSARDASTRPSSWTCPTPRAAPRSCASTCASGSRTPPPSTSACCPPPRAGSAAPRWSRWSCRRCIPRSRRARRFRSSTCCARPRVRGRSR